MEKGTNNGRVTLQKVAEHAGVSRATASLIVRGSPKVSQATKEKVLKSMQQLGYVYDRVAANLRSQDSKTVGLIITEIANPFFSELLDGVNEGLEQKGYTILLGSTSNSTKKQERLLATMIENRVAGIIWCPVSQHIEDSLFVQLNSLNIPAVLVGKQLPGCGFDYVGADNVAGAKLGVEHLLRKGHKKIAFLGGNYDSSAWQERKKGYILAHNHAGISVNDDLIIESPITRAGGSKAMNEILSQSNLPTAIFCYNDIIAIGAMQELKKKDLTPGKDIEVIGFDNIDGSEIFTPSLTTISAFPKLTGLHAAQILYKRMKGFSGKPENVIIQPEFIIRNSSL